ncbi:GDSL esterase/lipase-like [Dorcoceras hygrometricum]|uniref:GDSL esterase/lipase-like n=1 Tax=Dorcoceras hygrometricum TaxID=472368 RepID=A0A2Z7DFA2_9LAMI|nr:GDSL esterase/lipase-like [Dorcoceras hygrometricum]
MNFARRKRACSTTASRGQRATSAQCAQRRASSRRPAALPAAQQGAQPAAREAADCSTYARGGATSARRRDQRAHPSVSVDRTLAQPLAHGQPIVAHPVRDVSRGVAASVRLPCATGAQVARAHARERKAPPCAAAARWPDPNFDFSILKIKTLDTIMALSIDQIRKTLALIPLLVSGSRPPARQRKNRK